MILTTQTRPVHSITLDSCTILVPGGRMTTLAERATTLRHTPSPARAAFESATQTAALAAFAQVWHGASEHASDAALDWVRSAWDLIRTSTESAFGSERLCERCRVFDWMMICGSQIHGDKHVSREVIYGDKHVSREVVAVNTEFALTCAIVRMILKKPS